MITTDKLTQAGIQKTGVAVASVTPTGPACAAVLAPAIGTAVYGIVVAVAEAVPAIKNALTWSAGVGPLSGKTSVGVIAWIVAQIVLCALWHNREVNFRRVWTIALILIAIGFILTFPPVYDALSGH